jgi:lipase chaperone LimK
MSGSAMKNLRLFQSMCGSKAMLNVAIVTTMWSKVVHEDGIHREEELKQEVWHDMLDDGCRIEHFEDTRESAWRIVNNSSQAQASADVLLSHEVVDTRLRLNETTVGITLNAELEKLIKDRKTAARKFKSYAKNGDNGLVKKELNEIETKIDQIAEQLQEMKIPFQRRIRLFFKARRN